MKIRLPLAICAMVLISAVSGWVLDRFDFQSAAWSHAGGAFTQGLAAFVGGVIARRGFVTTAVLLCVVISIVTVYVLVRIGGDFATVIAHPMLQASLAGGVIAAAVGAWCGQRLATKSSGPHPHRSLA